MFASLIHITPTMFREGSGQLFGFFFPPGDVRDFHYIYDYQRHPALANNEFLYNEPVKGIR